MERRLVMRAIFGALAGLFSGRPGYSAGSRFETAPVIQFDGGWGSGDPRNLEFLATAVMDAILENLHPAEIASLPRQLKVRYDKSGPMALYEGEPGRSPAVLLLSASDKYWAQYIYQFAHEFGHVACNFRRADLRENRFQWLEEAICGAVSLYCLEYMAQNWPFPPGHRSHGFSDSMWSYLSERRRTYLVGGKIEDVRGWYLERAEDLSRTRALTSLNRPFAVWLVDRLRHDPSGFAGLRYLNLGSPDRSLSLTEHLLRWKRYCLPGRSELPVQLLAAFGDAP